MWGPQPAPAPVLHPSVISEYATRAETTLQGGQAVFPEQNGLGQHGLALGYVGTSRQGLTRRSLRALRELSLLLQ